jgi:hypothetical protein
MNLDVVLMKKVFDVLTLIFYREEDLFDLMLDIDVLKLLRLWIFASRRLI